MLGYTLLSLAKVFVLFNVQIHSRLNASGPFTYLCIFLESGSKCVKSVVLPPYPTIFESLCAWCFIIARVSGNYCIKFVSESEWL
jgi:hypothetical protein